MPNKNASTTCTATTPTNVVPSLVPPVGATVASVNAKSIDDAATTAVNNTVTTVVNNATVTASTTNINKVKATAAVNNAAMTVDNIQHQRFRCRSDLY